MTSPRAAGLLLGTILGFAVQEQTAAQEVVAEDVTVRDVGLLTGFQDHFDGRHRRGRALVAADFDLDGRTDFYVGNPKDECFVMRNVPAADGSPRFEVVQVLVVGEHAWGAASADYDNDGDYDLFVTVGGNEGHGFDHLFRNMLIESGGQLSFTDVTEQAGVKGPIRFGTQNAFPASSAGAVWADVDRDADVDLFVNVNRVPNPNMPENMLGRNVLWRNNGDGTFSDVTVAAGIGSTKSGTRHSTFFDIDNDGDLDLFESNHYFPNVLWKNLLVETGRVRFEDVTAEQSLPGDDLRLPIQTFASASRDFNNDGWQDLMLFFRKVFDLEPDTYGFGHALFLNMQGQGFRNVAEEAGINDLPLPDAQLGVMGCQVGDLNADGLPDLFFGNGGPSSGWANQLLMSNGLVGDVPRYLDRSDLIDFPAPQHPQAPPNSYPTYPYRTHGTSMVDLDEDGQLELAIVNGGRFVDSDIVREPNRLLRFLWNEPRNYFRVQPQGDGVTVSRDAIGTRLKLTVSEGGDQPRVLWKTLFGGSAFSAQNPFSVYFGLGNADTIESLEVMWPDGRTDVYDNDLEINTTRVLKRRVEPKQKDPKQANAPSR